MSIFDLAHLFFFFCACWFLTQQHHRTCKIWPWWKNHDLVFESWTRFSIRSCLLVIIVYITMINFLKNDTISTNPSDWPVIRAEWQKKKKNPSPLRQILWLLLMQLIRDHISTASKIASLHGGDLHPCMWPKPPASLCGGEAMIRSCWRGGPLIHAPLRCPNIHWRYLRSSETGWMLHTVIQCYKPKTVACGCAIMVKRIIRIIQINAVNLSKNTEIFFSVKSDLRWVCFHF